MKRTEFRLLPVPAELYDELGFTEDMTLEAFTEDHRLILQKADEEDTFCEEGDEGCEDCPYCCPAAVNASKNRLKK